MKKPAGTSLLFVALLITSCSSQEEATIAASDGGFTVVALGDAGEKNGYLRSIGSLLGRMQTGEHDGGRTDALVFLGDNFYPTGLNVPAADVGSKVNSILG